MKSMNIKQRKTFSTVNILSQILGSTLGYKQIRMQHTAHKCDFLRQLDCFIILNFVKNNKFFSHLKFLKPVQASAVDEPDQDQGAAPAPAQLGHGKQRHRPLLPHLQLSCRQIIMHGDGRRIIWTWGL